MEAAKKRLDENLSALTQRIQAKHQSEIDKLRRAVGPVPDFKGKLGSI